MVAGGAHQHGALGETLGRRRSTMLGASGTQRSAALAAGWLSIFFDVHPWSTACAQHLPRSVSFILSYICHQLEPPLSNSLSISFSFHSMLKFLTFIIQVKVCFCPKCYTLRSKGHSRDIDSSLKFFDFTVGFSSYRY